MRNPPHTAIVLAFLLTSVSEPQLRADWSDVYAYEVEVATTSTGPFGQSVLLWSHAASIPSSVMLTVDPDQGIALSDIGPIHSLAKINATAGTAPSEPVLKIPYFIKLTLHDHASKLSGSMILSGNVNSTVFPHFYTDLNPATHSLTLGDNHYDITLFPWGMHPPYNYRGIHWDEPVYASIAVNGLTEQPEPSTMLLAALGAVSIGLAKWRRSARTR